MRGKAKLMIKELLEVWDIRLGEMYLNVIYGKIDGLSDDKIGKTVETVKKYF